MARNRCRAAAVVLLVVVQACAPSPPPAPPAPTTTTADRTAEWVTHVCLADKAFQRIGLTAVPLETGVPPEEMAELLRTLRERVRTVIGAFEEIGPAPVEGGDEVVAAYVKALNDLLGTIDQAEARGPVELDGRNIGLLPLSLGVLALAPRGADLFTLAGRSAEVARGYETSAACVQPPVPARSVG